VATSDGALVTRRRAIAVSFGPSELRSTHVSHTSGHTLRATLNKGSIFQNRECEHTAMSDEPEIASLPIRFKDSDIPASARGAASVDCEWVRGLRSRRNTSSRPLAAAGDCAERRARFGGAKHHGE
jgi:hypothetical protein